MILSVLMRLPTYWEPFETDLSTYAVISHELLYGRGLYSDLWDNKPPGIFIIYALAEMLVGYGYQQIFFLNVLACWISLLGSYRAATALGHKQWIALAAATFWTLFSINFDIQANQPNTEVFLNACLIWSFVFFIRANSAQGKLAHYLAASVIFGIASLLKQVIFIYVVAFATVQICLDLYNGKSKIRLLLHNALLASGIPIFWGCAFIYFWLSGKLNIFIQSSFVYPQYYAGDVLSNIRKGIEFNQLFPSFFANFVFYFIASLSAICIGLWYKNKHSFYLMAYLIATPIAVALPGKFYPHYYQFWLPFLALSSAELISQVQSFLPSRFRWLIGTMLTAFLLYFSIHPSLAWYQMSADAISSRKYGDAYYHSRKLALQIKKISSPHERFYLWGIDPGLFFFSNRRPVAGVLWRDKIQEGPLQEKLTARTISQLENEKPSFVVVELDPFQSETSHAVTQWIRQHYEFRDPKFKQGPYALFFRTKGH